MSPEQLSALAAVGTFLVIGASAIAALIQLRHLRASNQFAAMLHVNERWDSPDIKRIKHFIDSEFPAKYDSIEYIQSLQTNHRDPEKHPEILVCDWWEEVGAMVKHGLIREEPLFDLTGIIIINDWNKLAPAIGILRKKYNTLAPWENFEYLVTRAMEYDRKYPRGAYPQGAGRLPTPIPAAAQQQGVNDSRP